MCKHDLINLQFFILNLLNGASLTLSLHNCHINFSTKEYKWKVWTIKFIFFKFIQSKQANLNNKINDITAVFICIVSIKQK